MIAEKGLIANTGKVLTAVSVFLFCFHIYIVLGFAFMFGSSLVEWAFILFVAGPIFCLLAVIASLIPPRTRWRLVLNICVLLIYGMYWGSMSHKIQWAG